MTCADSAVTADCTQDALANNTDTHCLSAPLNMNEFRRNGIRPPIVDAVGNRPQTSPYAAARSTEFYRTIFCVS